MLTRGILIIAILVLEAGVGYYSLVVDGSLFARFLFFLLSTAIVCLAIIKGIRYVLPREDYNHGKRKENQENSV